MAKKSRSDAERRLRQCERLSRVLRTLQLILGGGRWDADALADELECSRRTIQRILQTLSMAGVPWYYDQETRAYRVRPGFRFPGLDAADQAGANREHLPPRDIRPRTNKLIRDGEKFLGALQGFIQTLREWESENRP